MNSKRESGTLRAATKLGNAALCAIAAVWLFSSAAQADPFAEGVEFYQKRNFSRAAGCFETVLVRSPEQTNAMYYAGLTYQQMGNTPKALEFYNKLVTRYPNSQAGRLAQQALRGMGGSAVRSAGGGGSSGVSSYSSASSVRSYSGSSGGGDDEAGLPPQERLHFKNEDGQHIVVAGQVNGRALDFVFDTGCDQTVIGMDDLARCGLSKPTGPPTGKSIGVGNAITDNWRVSVNLRVGGIERRNFPLLVSDRTGVPALLGRNFYSPYQFTIDKSAGTINLVKNVTATAQTGRHGGGYVAANGGVPFRKLKGGGILVTAEVNGRPIEMLFDTGAQGCLFSAHHMKQLGIAIPDDAVDSVGRGVGGSTHTKNFPISRIRLGPVEKSNFTIGVTEIPFGEPLLGQSFFGDCQYTIDDQASVIRIRR
jgi:aspartyl protease family protein